MKFKINTLFKSNISYFSLERAKFAALLLKDYQILEELEMTRKNSCQETFS